MLDELMCSKINTLESVFDERRRVIPSESEPMIDGDGDVFLTEDGGVIYLEVVIQDFTVEQLVRFTSIAEKLYSEHKQHCTCYIICMGDVLVNEMPIQSEADFTIKLAKCEVDQCDMVLSVIKSKLNQGELLDEEDIKALQMLPLMCDKDKRDYYRGVVFSILTEIGL